MTRRTRVAKDGGLVVLVVALAVFLIAASACTSSDDETIEMPTAPSASETTSKQPAPKAKSIELFSGKTVSIDRVCALTNDVTANKADAVAAARRLPPHKQALLDAERDLDDFIAAHPERRLTSVDHATYQSLRRAYRSALRRYSRHVDAYNRLAARFNAGLEACARD